MGQGWRVAPAALLPLCACSLLFEQQPVGGTDIDAALELPVDAADALPPDAGDTTLVVPAFADSEENEESQVVDLLSTDLDIGFDVGPTLVAIEFSDIQIPLGATIKSASIRFTGESTRTSSINLVLAIDSAVPAAPLAGGDGDISNRVPGNLQPWDPPEWSRFETGPGQTTPDLSPLIQDNVDRPTWNSGQSLVFFFLAGNPNEDRREAFSVEGASAVVDLPQTAVPELTVVFRD